MKRFIPFSMLSVIGLSLAFLTLMGCKSYYVVSDFDIRTAKHQKIAVLPFEMEFTGLKPEKLTAEEVDKIGDAESKAFMISFYNEILRSTRAGNRPLRVDIQHYDKTISLLSENGIDIRSSWKEDPGKLADVLGVDAVIKARIEKHRLMSDLASYGIDMGVHIISILGDNIWFWLPADIAKAKEIKTSYSLLDRQGTVLWSIAFDIDADWSRTANEIIDSINRRSVKHFPYRS